MPISFLTCITATTPKQILLLSNLFSTLKQDGFSKNKNMIISFNNLDVESKCLGMAYKIFAHLNSHHVFPLALWLTHTNPIISSFKILILFLDWNNHVLSLSGNLISHPVCLDCSYLFFIYQFKIHFFQKIFSCTSKFWLDDPHLCSYSSTNFGYHGSDYVLF